MKKRTGIGLSLLVLPLLSHAGDLENIGACVDAASQHSGVDLDMRSVAYDANILSNSTATWPNAYCEIKFEKVYVLKIDGRDVIVNGYAGQESYNLNETLATRTKAAMDQLDRRKEVLTERMRDASERLTSPAPDHSSIESFVNDGISEALSQSGLSEVIAEQSAQRLREEESRLDTPVPNVGNRLTRAQNEEERVASATMQRSGLASPPVSKQDVLFTERDFYWDSVTTPHKETIIAGVNKIFHENSRCTTIDASSAYVSSDRGTAVEPVFFVTCENEGNAFNVFFSKSDIGNEITLPAIRHIERSTAIDRCEEYAISVAANPSTVEFSKLMSLNVVEHPNGRTSVTSAFTARSGFDVEEKFDISCMLDGAGLFEAIVTESN